MAPFSVVNNRHDFIMGFYGRIDGLREVLPRRRLGVHLYDSTGHFETTGTLSASRGLGTLEELQFASSRTSKPVEVAVAGPLTLAKRHPPCRWLRQSRATPGGSCWYVKQEVDALAAAGCRSIQVDEPYYHHEFTDRPELIRYAYDAVTADVHSATLGLRICFGNLRGRPHSPGTYRRVLPVVSLLGIG